MHIALRATALSILTMLFIAPACADEAAELRRLQRGGDHAGALARADRYLATRPNDAAVRFQRAVALAELKRSDEAIDAFRALTQEHPELAEPYNNLAALHAAQGRIEQARAALEQALRADPGYAVAHENLGDVYAMLAAQAWERAAQTDPANRSAATKLVLARDLLRIKNPKE